MDDPIDPPESLEELLLSDFGPKPHHARRFLEKIEAAFLRFGDREVRTNVTNMSYEPETGQLIVADVFRLNDDWVTTLPEFRAYIERKFPFPR